MRFLNTLYCLVIISSSLNGVIAEEVRLEVGDNFQQQNDLHPNGTVFRVATGVHLEQRVGNPKAGNTWIGEVGAVMDGRNTASSAFHGHAENVTIEGLELRNYTDNGIYFLSGRNLTFHKVSFSDLGSGDGEANGAIRLQGVEGLAVTECFFTRVSSAILPTLCQGPIRIEWNQGVNIGRNFVQLAQCTGPGIRVNYNTMERVGDYLRPEAQDVEDWISVYKVEGLLDDPAQFNYNRARGHGPSVSGSFIMLGDGGGRFLEAVGNIGVSPGQVGIGLCGGQYIEIRDNLMFSDPWEQSNIAYYSHNFYYPEPSSDHSVLRNRANWLNRDGKSQGFWTSGNTGPVNMEGNVFPDETLNPEIWDEWERRYTGYGLLSDGQEWGSTPEAQRGAMGDANGNGISNFTELAFNLDPTASSMPSKLTPGTGTFGMPYDFLLSPTPETTPTLAVEFLRRKYGGLTYTVKFSGDLSLWDDATDTPSITNIDDDWERVVVKDVDGAGDGKRFVTIIIETAGVAWTPNEITTTAWYDASDAGSISITAANDGKVSQWNDKSGNGNHATQDSSAEPPTTGARIGYLNALNFNADVLNTSLTQLTTVSMYLVLDANQIAGNSNNSPIGATTDYVSGGCYITLQNYNDGSPNYWTNYDGSALSNASLHAVNAGQSHNFQPSIISHSGTGLSTQSLTYKIGTSRTDGLQSYLGTIGEIIICPQDHDEATRQKIEGYLAHKWGLTANLAEGHPYKYSAPTVARPEGVIP